MNQNLTDITIVLDRSGSMGRLAQDVVGGYATFIKEQQALPGDANISLVQFDSMAVESVYTSVAVASINPALNFQPRGGTPLLDALGQTIVATGARLANIPEALRPGKVLFLVITDGEENQSTEYTKERIKEMIEHQTSVYGWGFVYLGANVDAFNEAGKVGIASASAGGYAASASGVRSMYAVLSDVTTRVRESDAPASFTSNLSDENRETLKNSK